MDKSEKRLAKLLGDAGLTFAGLEADAKRPRGRPRKTPVGARERKWLATDEEYARAEAAAARLGISVPELVRRRVLKK